MFILGPNDSKVSNSTTDSTHSNFGGQRAVTAGVSKAEDYTQRTTTAAEVQENPVDDTTKDVDDMNDPQSRKSDTLRQTELMGAGTPGDENFIFSDLEKKPLDEGREDSAFITPDPDKPHGSLAPFNPDFADVGGVDDEGN
jgi:hypothetical protein